MQRLNQNEALLPQVTCFVTRPKDPLPPGVQDRGCCLQCLRGFTLGLPAYAARN